MTNKRRTTDTSEDDAIKQIVSKSGNALHCEVASFFRLRGWTTRLSQYYVDATTDKAREIDLVVEKVFEFADGDDANWVHLHIRLSIECKYIRQPVVFWFDTIDQKSVNDWIDGKPPFSKKNSYSKQLHYKTCGTDAAKLFASGGHGDESDPLFRALNQVLHGFLQTRGRSIIETRARNNLKVFSLMYPVIVFSSFDHFYRTHVNGSPAPTPLRDNFLFEVNYAYPNRLGISIPEYFLVDMVAFANLDKFLEALDVEVKAAEVIA